jgi:high-affinity iron transporter
MMRWTQAIHTSWSLLAAVCLLLVATRGAAAAGGDDMAALRASIEQARALYASDPVRARDQAGDAFFRFESSGLDRRIAARDPAGYKALEAEWLKLVSLMRASADQGAINAQSRKVVDHLTAAAAPEQASSQGALFLNGVLIILREGFEAILILSAVAAALRAAGSRSGLRLLSAGAVVAIVASLALAVAAHWLGDFGAGREALEGVTCLVAVAVLFWTSYWLISRVEGKRWQRFVAESVAHAISGGRGWMIALLAFVVVFREGFETVLFYQALTAEAAGVAGGTLTVLSGLVLGVLLLCVLYAAITRFGLRIPIGRFFAVTGAMLYILAIKFAGSGIRELQEASWIASTPVTWMPEVDWLRDWLGVYPFREPLALQAVLVLAVVVGVALTWRRRRPAAQPIGAHGRSAA